MAGPLLIILGAAPLLYIYAFASMFPPEQDGWNYWSLVLGTMFNFADAGWLSLASCVVADPGDSYSSSGALSYMIADAARYLIGSAARRPARESPPAQ